MSAPNPNWSVWDTAGLAAALFEHQAVALLLVDPGSGHLLDANPHACQLGECTRQELLRLRFSDLVRHEREPRDSASLLREPAFAAPEGYLFRASRADRWSPVGLTVRHLRGTSHAAVALVTLHDRREVEALLRLRRAEPEPLPVAAPPSQPSPDRVDRLAPPEEEAPQGRWTVLVADDEETVLDVSVRMLTSIGCEVVAARDGEEAVARFQARAWEIQLALIDLTMPRLSGEATMRKLRGLAPSLPLVLMSGHSECDVAPRFADVGLAGYLQKPFRLPALRELLRQALPA